MKCKGCQKPVHFYQEKFEDNTGEGYHIECYRKQVDEQKQADDKSKLRGYIGWQGYGKNETIRINNTGDPNEDIRKLVQEEIDKRDNSVKQYDDLMAQAKAQLISVLNRNVQPELNILSEKLLEQTQDSRNKGLCLVCNKAQSSQQDNCNNPICNDCMTKILLDNIQQGHMARLKVGW